MRNFGAHIPSPISADRKRGRLRETRQRARPLHSVDFALRSAAQLHSATMESVSMSGAENSGPKTRSMPTGGPKKSRYVSRAPGQSASGGGKSGKSAASKAMSMAARGGRQRVTKLRD